MNPKYLGDSYDLVKRFFCDRLHEEGYCVELDGRFSGVWTPQLEASFRVLIGVTQKSAGRRALFVDPDTGVQERYSPLHVTYQYLVECCAKYELVMVFDQSFSRAESSLSAMNRKLRVLEERECYGMYYNSHAPFLFVARERSRLDLLRARIVGAGLPVSRLVVTGDVCEGRPL